MSATNQPHEQQDARVSDTASGDDSWLDLIVPLAARWKALVLVPLLAGGLAAGALYFVVQPTFTARTSILPPQQQQSAAASALASIGALAGLAGGGGLRTPADQYVALMQSATVTDKLIDRFKLLDVYEVDFRSDARRVLGENVRITVGKKDGLLSIEVDDKSPRRAADMANAHVEELRALTSTLAITEAQQRRAFFERQLQSTRDKLTAAQQALQASGFSQGALRAEPKAAAEGYARIKAEVTASEVRLQALRSTFADNAPEVAAQQSVVSSLRAQLARAEQATDLSGAPDYIGKYRDYKYQETLFELFSRQYELARIDESREGALIQVVDTAVPPDKKSKPKRVLLTLVAVLASLLATAAWILSKHAIEKLSRDPLHVNAISRLRTAFGRIR